MDSSMQWTVNSKPCVSAFGCVHDEGIFFSPGTSTGKVASPSLKYPGKAALSHISPNQKTEILKIDLRWYKLEVISPTNEAD